MQKFRKVGAQMFRSFTNSKVERFQNSLEDKRFTRFGRFKNLEGSEVPKGQKFTGSEVQTIQKDQKLGKVHKFRKFKSSEA